MDKLVKISFLRKVLASVTLVTLVAGQATLGVGTTYAGASDGACNAGDATIVAPASGDVISGTYNVNWVFNGPDCDTAGTAEVLDLEYDNGGGWTNIGTTVATTDTSMSVDTTTLGGDDNDYQFRLVSNPSGLVIDTTAWSDVIVDNASPTITSVVTADSEPNGYVDQIIVTIDDGLVGSGMDTCDIAGWSVTADNTTPITVSSCNVDSPTQVTLNLTEDTTNFLTDNTPQVVYTAGGNNNRDLGGNELNSITINDAIDGAAPVALSAVYSDSNANGKVDTIQVTLSENINAFSGKRADWDVATSGTIGFQETSSAADADITLVGGSPSNVVQLKDASAEIARTGNADITGGAVAPEIRYTQGTGMAKDLAGNELVDFTNLAVSDGASPIYLNSTTLDNNNDGTADYVKVEYSENVDDSTINATDFEIGIAVTTAGNLIEGFASGMPSTGNETDIADDNIVYISISNGTETILPMKTDYTLRVEQTGPIDDNSINGNTLASFSPKISADGEAPVIASVSYNHNPAEDLHDTDVTVVLSEDIVGGLSVYPLVSIDQQGTADISNGITTNDIGDNRTFVYNYDVKVADGLNYIDGDAYVGVSTATDGVGNTMIPVVANITSGYLFVIDTTAPLISNVGSGTTQTGATITWDTDELSTSQVEYGLSGGDGSNMTITDLTADNTSHSVTLNGLTCETSYDFSVSSTDEAGNTSNSGSFSLTTTACDIDSPALLSNISGTGTSATTGEVLFDVNEDVTSQVYFGTTADYGNVTAPETSLSGSNTTTISGLICEKTYLFELHVTDSGDNVTTATGSFDTQSCGLDTTAPVISSVLETPSQTGATITWDTDDNATSQIEYGLGTDYGNVTAQDDTADTSIGHLVELTGLDCGETYNYRIISTNGNNLTSYQTGTVDTVACDDTTPPEIYSLSLDKSQYETGEAMMITVVEDGDSNAVNYTNSGTTGALTETTTADTWTGATTAPMTPGVHTVVVTATDLAGNYTTQSINYLVVLPDTTAPMLMNSTPSNGATFVSVGSGTATLLYDEDLNINSNTGITITKVSDGTSVKNGDATLLANEISIPYNALEYNTSYRITVQAGAIEDSKGNDTTTNLNIYFTTQSIDAPEILSLGISNITNSGATIDWSTDVVSDTVEYRVSAGANIYSSSWSGATSGSTGSIDLSGLDPATEYYYQVKFTSGGETTESVPLPFTTARGVDGLYTDKIWTIDSIATAGGDYDLGWHFRFLVTVEDMTETDLGMKLADWMNVTSDTLAVSGNTKIAVSNGGVSDHNLANTAVSNDYSAYADIDGLDADLATGGRQVYVDMFVRIPTGQAGGSYTTSYGIQSQ